jgi:hypothetical protein
MKVITPYNPGMILENIPGVLLNQLKLAVKEKRINSDTFRNYRKDSLQILSIKEIDDTPYVKELSIFLMNMFEEWCKIFDVKCNSYDIRNVWTNYMKAGEFAPMHKHTPAIASFVIWIQIPYKKENEKHFHYENDKLDDSNRNGSFEILYSTYGGTIQTHRIDLEKKDEGTILMFQGNLMHCVYPFFSSDQERISIAGNIYNNDQIEII